jgi:transcription elongation factor GreB
MRKGFTRKPQGDEPATPSNNYITPGGLQRLKDEHRFLLTRERPAVTEVVAWAASNGDRSENADYQYGKRRLRQIDGRIRFLTKRIESAEVVDPETPRAGKAATRAFFGATVRYANAVATERVVSIVGTDEVDLNRKPHQLGIASGARVDEVGSGRSRSSPSAGRYSIPDRAGSVLRAHFGGTVP